MNASGDLTGSTFVIAQFIYVIDGTTIVKRPRMA